MGDAVVGSSGSEEDGGDVTDNKNYMWIFGVICSIGAIQFLDVSARKYYLAG